MARAVDYSIGPGMGPLAITKSGGGTVRWAPGLGWIWSVVCEIKATAAGPSIGAVPLAAALAQEIDLNTAFPNGQFPENVQCGEAYIKRVVDFAGGTVSAMSIQVGDTANVDELVTAIDIFTGALATAEYTGTVGAASYAMHVETAYAPTITLTVIGDDLDQLNPGGSVTVCIPIRPLHD